MQNLNRLFQIASAASVITDLARQKQTHTLPVIDSPATIYIHSDDAAVRIVRWQRQQVEVTLEIRPPIAWRFQSEYDANGVYLVALKRPGFGKVATANMQVLVPADAHLVLRMQGGMVSLDHIDGILHLDPPERFVTLPNNQLGDGINKK